ncbi:hypothetical protein HIM_01533 [Hirsutella minnesotensis 3608]|nr:hypothetical protein HIM_01533 [Hirsutella minnesotensis 3608]
MAPTKVFRDLNLSIIGLGSQYPPGSLNANVLDAISEKHYPPSPAMKKTLAINKGSGIETRSSFVDLNHPLVDGETAPSNAELHRFFISNGVPLAVKAAREAILEAGIDISEITHIVSTTCTDSANPGFDHVVERALGITHPVERVLLHGVGCSGGLAALRTASNLALGSTALGRPARILCVALEVCTVFARCELDRVHKEQEVQIGMCLFSDGASALVLSNGIGGYVEPIYQVLGWEHSTIPESQDEIRFDVHPSGWRTVLGRNVPVLTKAAIPQFFARLKSKIGPGVPESAADYDWALHPGGPAILSGAASSLGLSDDKFRASNDVYRHHGNSSSATIFSVMNRLRRQAKEDRVSSKGFCEHVVACAFGPGVVVEMIMLRRHPAVLDARPISKLKSSRWRSPRINFSAELRKTGERMLDWPLGVFIWVRAISTVIDRVLLM